MATFSDIKKELKELFNPYINPVIREGLNHENLKAVNRVSFVITVLETIILLFCIFSGNSSLTSPAVMDNTIYAIIVSLFTFLISDVGLKSSKHPYSRYSFLCVAYYLLIMVFGMFVSYYNYTHGKQILVFYAIVFCLVNFFIIPPYLSTFLILGSYLIFYLLLYSYDQASTILILNYVILALFTLAGSYHKYHLQGAELERIHRIETMNDMLQNVPVHDNTTDLKNRYALRDDFDSYQNHHIIVIMLDIDDFGKINAEYGRGTGDIVLSQVGELIKTHLSDNHSYRYGADSFLIILQDVEVDTAMQKLSAWEKSMSSLCIPDTTKRIHLSSGYSHGTPRDEEDLRLLIEAADRKRRDFSL